MTVCLAKPAGAPAEIDVARPLEAQPRYREIGLHYATNDDVAYLWREAQDYFARATAAGDAPGAERLRRLGTHFALMAIALLGELAQAARQLRER